MNDSHLKGRVLIVEDQFLASEFLRIWVEAYGLEVCGVATNADDAIALAREKQPTHVLMDVRLDGPKDGIEAASEIQTFSDPRIIYCTGSSETGTVERIKRQKPFDVLFKPVDSQRLGDALLRA